MKLSAYFGYQQARLRSSADHNILEAVVHQGMLRVQNRDLRLGRVRKSRVPKIADNADKAYVGRIRNIFTGGDLQKWRRSNMDLPAHGIFYWKIAALELLTDECHGPGTGAV